MTVRISFDVATKAQHCNVNEFGARSWAPRGTFPRGVKEASGGASSRSSALPGGHLGRAVPSPPAVLDSSPLVPEMVFPLSLGIEQRALFRAINPC